MLVAAPSVVLEQALFTSLRSIENEGYQIAAHSAGVDDELCREITAWAPSHESLQPSMGETSSINAHQLGDGSLCLSLTRIASSEYSGRGQNVATWLLIAPAEALSMFGYHPLRLLDAALAAGWTSGHESSSQLSSLTLIGRARAVNLEAVAQATSIFGATTLAALVERTALSERLGIVVEQNRRLLIDALFSLLPMAQRFRVSFTTGLLPSPRRPFGISLLGSQAEVQRAFRRTFSDGSLLDLAQPLPKTERTPAVQGLAQLLESERWCEIRRRVLDDQ